MGNTLFKILKLSYFTPSQKIAISFGFVIFLGAFLLMLPISNQNGAFFPFIDALFTATSAVCVTGLAISPPAIQFTLFGQIIMLLLIQIGGLGLMTLIATIAVKLRNYLSLQDKITIREMLNQSNMLDFKSFLKRIVKYTLFFEMIGTLFLCIVFIPDYGPAKGLFTALFTAVSAFCNAGFDLIGHENLVPYAESTIVNFTVMGLIIMGGLGFIVYFDIRDKIGALLHRKLRFRLFLSRLMLQTKIVLLLTFLLLLLPALLIFLFEHTNIDTLGSLSFPGKIYASLFNSTTLRTAGFATVNFGLLTQATQFIMMICMFIGGSPGGSAGGIKTTTFAILILCLISALKGNEKIVIFHRNIPKALIQRSIAIFMINIVALFLGILVLLICTPFNFMEICFEATSALATVGLSLGITSHLPTLGKVVIIILMYVGRIGIITFLVSFVRKQNKEVIDYADGSIMIG